MTDPEWFPQKPGFHQPTGQYPDKTPSSVVFEFANNRILKLCDSIDCSVFGLAVVDCLDGCIFDVIWRIEIRLTRTQTDHVAPLST